MDNQDQSQLDQVGTQLPNPTILQVLPPIPTIGYVEEPRMIWTANSGRHNNFVSPSDYHIQNLNAIQGYNNIGLNGVTGDCNYFVRYKPVEIYTIPGKPAGLDGRFSFQSNFPPHGTTETNFATEVTSDIWGYPIPPYYDTRTNHSPPLGVLSVENINHLQGNAFDQPTNSYDIVHSTDNALSLLDFPTNNTNNGIDTSASVPILLSPPELDTSASVPMLLPPPELIERPIVAQGQRIHCRWANCTSAFSRLQDVLRHVQTVHLNTPHFCHVDGCNKAFGGAFKGYSRFDKVQGHLAQKHK